MNADLLRDPVAAWSPFEPTAATPWNKRLAAHLFRRVGFGATVDELTTAAEQSPAEAVAKLLNGPPADLAFERQMQATADTVRAGGNAENLSAWWLYRMRYTPDPALEKLTLFWHGHFATSAAKVKDMAAMFAQNELLRRDARGDFTRMTQAISRDPAMLTYLDATVNRKTHPNENYARELLELFCLGLGNYKERDIQEVARAFSGGELRHGTFQFNPYQHDRGAKTFFGRTGNFGGEEAVRIVCEQPAAPRFIATKLYRFFIADEPQPTPELIEPLAKQLRDDRFQLPPTLNRMLGSRLFFSEAALGRKVRSPIELAIGVLRSLEGSTNLYRLATDLGQLGQSPFFPPNVKGWDGGRTWINSATLIGRGNLIGRLVRDRQHQFAGGTLATFAEKHGLKSPEQIVDGLSELLVAVPPPASVRTQLIQLANAGGDPVDRLANVIHTLGALPEFQLG